MCTIATWKNNGIGVVSGRTLDWFESMDSSLWVMPAGIEHTGITDDANPLTWTSKYGSVATSVYDIATCDGLNEKGLSMHMLWLVESDYGTRDVSLPGMSVSLWGQYFLDNFAGVAEAVEHAKAHPFQLATGLIGSKQAPATAHLSIVDTSGDMAVFEYIDGKLHVHHDNKYEVMTNSPPFKEQLQNIKEYEDFGGNKPIPGTTSAADRFVRTAYYLKHLKKPENERELLAGIFSVIRNASQPFGLADPKQPNISPTIWRTVSDHDNLRYYFESTTSPFLVWADLKTFDLSKGAPVRKYDLEANPDSSGNISKDFADSQPLQWLLAS